MKKITSQVKTIKDDFTDMAVNHLNKPSSPDASSTTEPDGQVSKSDLQLQKDFVVDDFEIGTFVRKTAVHLGLLLDDGVDFSIRANPARRLVKSIKSRKDGEKKSKAEPEEVHYEIRYRQKINIETEDGISLCANLFAPSTDDPKQRFPAIVFINSWCMDKHQYLLQARRFARNGYLVLSYSARGWGKSGGVVNVGGPDDMRDVSTVLDWLIDNTPIQPENIGFSGISYGSGLSLLGAAHDKRIKTVVGMSGWSDLFESFFSEQTPRQFFAKVLVGTSKLSAKTDDTLDYMLDSLLTNQHVEEVEAWAKIRSPVTYVEKYNRQNTPIYLVQNFQDELFQPNSVIDFYSQLTGPKRIDLNKGTHGSAELSGILGLKNHLWLQTHAWFDHWLKGVPNGITEQPPISCQFERSKKFRFRLGEHEGDRHTLEEWATTGKSMICYYLAPPIDSAVKGVLGNKPVTDIATSSIYSNMGTSKSTAGIPLISSSKNAHFNMPLKLNLSKLTDRLAVAYESAPVKQCMCIMGTPQLSLTIETTRPQVQLIAYLYEANDEGHGNLITHGPMTRHFAKPGCVFDVSFELLTTCYEIQKGRHLVLVIDTSDMQYQSPTKDDVKVTFHFGSNGQATLSVPMIVST